MDGVAYTDLHEAALIADEADEDQRRYYAKRGITHLRFADFGSFSHSQRKKRAATAVQTSSTPPSTATSERCPRKASPNHSPRSSRTT